MDINQQPLMLSHALRTLQVGGAGLHRCVLQAEYVTVHMSI